MSGTVRVRMLQGPTHPRYDGRPWPPPGEEFDVPEWEADMITLADSHQSVSLAARVVPGTGSGGPEIKDGMWTVPAAEKKAPEAPAVSKPPATEPAVKAPASSSAREPGAPPGAELKAPAAAHHAQVPVPEGRDEAAHHAPVRDEDRHAGADNPVTVTGTVTGRVTGTVDSADDAPPASASKQDWVAYAVSRGAGEHDAGSMTKADLMSRYGTRPGSE
jgi:hypothetical protein